MKGKSNSLHLGVSFISRRVYLLIHRTISLITILDPRVEVPMSALRRLCLLLVRSVLSEL